MKCEEQKEVRSLEEANEKKSKKMGTSKAAAAKQANKTSWKPDCQFTWQL